jgi:soluble cytochrome b562
MFVSGISGSSLFNYSTQNVQSNMNRIRQEFQQLGQDLQSGNLSAAQTDFATLEQLEPQVSSATSAHGSNPIAQAVNQLSQDLQAGNLSAAQKDYATIQQDFKNQGVQMHGHHHHGSGSGSGSNPINQLLQQLGQALQSGNLSSAQQLFSSLQQAVQQFGQNSGRSLSTASSQPSSNRISINA